MQIYEACCGGVEWLGKQTGLFWVRGRMCVYSLDSGVELSYKHVQTSISKGARNYFAKVKWK